MTKRGGSLQSQARTIHLPSRHHLDSSAPALQPLEKQGGSYTALQASSKTSPTCTLLRYRAMHFHLLCVVFALALATCPRVGGATSELVGECEEMNPQKADISSGSWTTVVLTRDGNKNIDQSNRFHDGYRDESNRFVFSSSTFDGGRIFYNRSLPMSWKQGRFYVFYSIYNRRTRKPDISFRKYRLPPYNKACTVHKHVKSTTAVRVTYQVAL